MRATAGKSVTVMLGKNNFTTQTYNPFIKGQLINLSWHKRLKGLIKEIQPTQSAITLTLRNGYMAAPKSKLRRKSVFSKIKSPVLNPKN